MRECCSKPHIIKPEQTHDHDYELLIKYFTIIEEPFDSRCNGKLRLNKFLTQYATNKLVLANSEYEEVKKKPLKLKKLKKPKKLSSLSRKAMI